MTILSAMVAVLLLQLGQLHLPLGWGGNCLRACIMVSPQALCCHRCCCGLQDFGTLSSLFILYVFYCVSYDNGLFMYQMTITIVYLFSWL
ncbi:hypothetical protein BDQ17DRAFT_1362527 [Cyathus striatus]|nr:hypothetical protein BDQ17DRAFT_1362527 [Cyathus striatus]